MILELPHTRTQLRLAWTALVVVVLMLVLPPWLSTLHVSVRGQRIDAERPVGYAPIFAPPRLDRDGPATGVRIDFSRLLLQVAAVGLITLALWWRLGRSPRVVVALETPPPSDADALDRAYRRLDVERTTSPDALRETYRDLVRVWHPDRFRDDPELQQRAAAKLREINRAYERIQASWASSASQTTGPDPSSRSQRAVSVPRPQWTWPATLGVVLVVAVSVIVWIIGQVPPPSSQRTPPTGPAPAPEASPQTGRTLLPEGAAGGPAPQTQSRRSGPTLEEMLAAADRPDNGVHLVARGPEGLGMLTIDNGSERDAFVLLVDERRQEERTRWAFYVWAKTRVPMTGIGPGAYRVQFSLGTEWDPQARHFVNNRSFLQFVDPLRFTEERTSDGIRYQTYELTLHTVPGGTARTARLDERDFKLD
jgi:hypothetical protein